MIHEFLPAIVGKATADSVYKEVENKAPIINIKYYRPRTVRGAHSSRSSLLWPHTASATALPGPATPSRTSPPPAAARPSPACRCSGTTRPHNNMNGIAPGAASAEDSVEQVLQHAGSPSRTARPVRQFDASLADPLFQLPPSVQPDTLSPSLLAQRNLLRGKKMGLPSGQQVARLMGVTPLTNDQLRKNHRIEVTIPIPTSGNPSANVVNVEREFDEENRAQADLRDLGMERRGPAVVLHPERGRTRRRMAGRTLGPVGGRIVAEVLVGLLQKDPNSYLYLQPNWKPQLPIAQVKGQFTMADLLTYAGVWS